MIVHGLAGFAVIESTQNIFMVMRVYIPPSSGRVHHSGDSKGALWRFRHRSSRNTSRDTRNA